MVILNAVWGQTKITWPITIISWLGREMRIDRLWNHVSLWLQTSLLHPNSGLSRIMFFPVCIKFKVTVFPSHSSKYNTSVGADFPSAFFIAMEHEFMKVIYSYRQQRDFEQKFNTYQCCSPIFSARYAWTALPGSGGVLQTFTAVMQLIRVYIKLF